MLVRGVLKEIKVHLVMDIGVHKVSLVLQVFQDQLDQEAPLALQETLGQTAGQDREVNQWPVLIMNFCQERNILNLSFKNP